MLMENALRVRRRQATPATKLLIREFICVIEQDAQGVALPEIARIPTIAKQTRVDALAFSRQIIEFRMICIRLAQLLTDLQHPQTLCLQLAVETSRVLRRFNAVANPGFVTPK